MPRTAKTLSSSVKTRSKPKANGRKSNVVEFFSSEPYVNEHYVNEPYVNERFVSEPYVNERFVSEPYVNEHFVNTTRSKKARASQHIQGHACPHCNKQVVIEHFANGGLKRVTNAVLTPITSSGKLIMKGMDKLANKGTLAVNTVHEKTQKSLGKLSNTMVGIADKVFGPIANRAARR